MNTNINKVEINSPEDALNRLIQGNNDFVNGAENKADISKTRRENTTKEGQKPFAVIVTCSDSRTPPEHIFSAGIGDLFVIRSAGNVVDDFGLGSIEYGVKHLGAKIVVVLGHDKCGAVTAAIAEHTEGHITNIVKEIRQGIKGEQDQVEAENINIAHGCQKIMNSPIVAGLVESKEIAVAQAKYDMASGKVVFFD